MKYLLSQFRRLRLTSKLFMLLGIVFLLPLLMLIPYGETEHTFSFILPALLSFGIGLLLGFLMLVTTKTVSGHSYLFPLIPLNWNALKKLMFRTSK